MDCFGYFGDKKCKVLNTKKCAGKCAFHKTAKQYEESNKKSIERIASLDRTQILNIASTYYPTDKEFLREVGLE